MEQTLSIVQVFRARDNVVSCALGEGSALLDMDSSTYYSLNPVGSHIWTLIQEPRTFDVICESIVDTFDVAADVCRSDLSAMLQQLAASKLIVISDAANG